MADVNVRLDTKGLDRLLATLIPKTQRAVARAAFDTETRAKQLAPVRTGTLRRSIHATPVAGDPLAWVVGTNVEYASFVEHGTRKMAARPFLRPAVEEKRARLRDYIREVFR